MTTDLARTDPADVTLPDEGDVRAALAHYLVTGDVSKLSGEQRLALYFEICRSIRINPRTRPLDFIEFWDPQTKQKKLTLYPTHAAADQLAYLHRIRIRVAEEKTVGTLYKLRLEGTMPDGRTEENVAYLSLLDPQGQLLAGQRYGDALMKAHTKAKRRLVFGMVGFNVPVAAEELERGRRVLLDAGGNVMDQPTEEQRYLAEHPRVARVIGEPTWEDAALPETGLEGEPDTVPAAAAGPPRRTGPRPSFKPSEEQRERWRKQWLAMADGTIHGDDEGRHRFFRGWTNGRTQSSVDFFATATERQAMECLEHTRIITDEEKAQQAAAEAESEEVSEEERPF